MNSDWKKLEAILNNYEIRESIMNSWEYLINILPELNVIKGFDQKSIYHDKDVLEHTLFAMEHIAQVNKKNSKTNPRLMLAMLLHDIGKPEVFTYDEETSKGHMKKHQKASEVIAIRFMKELDLPEDFIEYTSKLILLHDDYSARDDESMREQVRVYDESFGRDFLEDFNLLQEADVLAHSPLGQERITIIELRKKHMKLRFGN